MMTELATQTPLAIDRVERARAKHARVRLRVSGRWLTDARSEYAPTLLVIQLHGRRLRFPAGDDDQGDQPDPTAGSPFQASFTIPDWAVPEQAGQAVLWVGETVVAVPPPGMAPLPTPARVAPHEASEPETAQPTADDLAGPTAGPIPTGSTPGRSGPLAQLLNKETIAALHGELEQRSVESAQLRSALAAARSDLQGGSAARSELEAAHRELREELGRLMAVASEQRDEFEQRLADAAVERGRLSDELAGAGGELAELRDAVTRAETELTRAREEVTLVGEERDRARRELVDAGTEQGRSAERITDLREELVRAREAGEDRLAAARSDFDQRLAAARSESEAAIGAARAQAQSDAEQARAQADAELDAARSETETMLSAARGDSESRAAAAGVQVVQLNEHIAMLAAEERLRSAQAAGLREQFAAAQIARDAALSEADGLRVELDRLGGELAVMREQSGPPGSDLSEARRLLADARALTLRLRGDSPA